MRKKILIFGCGSVGAHHANAARRLNFDVYITDIKSSQFKIFKEKLYISRYKKWDKKINYLEYSKVYNSTIIFDLIIIGTSPKSHLKVLDNVIKKLKYKKILIEKPLCVFDELSKIKKFLPYSKKIFCGFNHTVSSSILKVFEILKKNKLGKIRSIDIKWHENFENVLKAHPWIVGLKESYLSNLKLGGGGLHEYSHALHLLMNFKNLYFRKKNFFYMKKIIFNKKFNFDEKTDLSLISNDTSLNLSIDTRNVVEKKEILIVCQNGNLLWTRNQANKKETIKYFINDEIIKIDYKIPRYLDFLNQLKLILNNKQNKFSYLKLNNLENSYLTMKLLNKTLNEQNFK